MSDVQDDLLKLLPLLYKTPGDEAAWGRFLASFTQATGAVQGLLIHHNTVNQQTNLASGFNLDEEFAHSYETYYQFKNPYLSVHPSKLPKPGTFGLLNELIPDKEVVKTEFFNDYVVPQKLTTHNAIRITPLQSDKTYSAIALHYASKQSCINSNKALKICELLMPHLQTALQLHNKIGGLEVRLNRLTSTFDQIPLGIILLDISGCPNEINDQAKGLLYENDGLSICNNHLQTRLAQETTCLNKLIQTALKTALGKSISPAGIFQVQRPSGKRPYNLLITPISEQIESTNGLDSVVAIFISDPESTQESLGAVVQRLYGLTNAEKNVTLLLIQGYDTKMIGERLSIQRETIKFHLKHIFQKTGTRRQSELISVILRGSAMLTR